MKWGDGAAHDPALHQAHLPDSAGYGVWSSPPSRAPRSAPHHASRGDAGPPPAPPRRPASGTLTQQRALAGGGWLWRDANYGHGTREDHAEAACDVCCAAVVIIVGVVCLSIDWVEVPLQKGALRDLAETADGRSVGGESYPLYARLITALLVIECCVYVVLSFLAALRCAGTEGAIPVASQCLALLAAVVAVFLVTLVWLVVEDWDGEYYTPAPFLAFCEGLLIMVHGALKCTLFPRMAQMQAEEVEGLR